MRFASIEELHDLDEAWLTSSLRKVARMAGLATMIRALSSKSSRLDDDSEQLDPLARPVGAGSSRRGLHAAVVPGPSHAIDEEALATEIATELGVAAAVTASDAVRLCALACMPAAAGASGWRTAARTFAALKLSKEGTRCVPSADIRVWLAESAPVAALGAHSAITQLLIETARPEQLQATLEAVKEEMAYGASLLGLGVIRQINSEPSDRSSPPCAAGTAAAPVTGPAAVAESLASLRGRHADALAALTSCCELLAMEFADQRPAVGDATLSHLDTAATATSPKPPDLSAGVASLWATETRKEATAAIAARAAALACSRNRTCIATDLPRGGTHDSTSSSSSSSSTTSAAMLAAPPSPVPLSRWCQALLEGCAPVSATPDAVPVSARLAPERAQALSRAAIDALMLAQQQAAAIAAILLIPLSSGLACEDGFADPGDMAERHWQSRVAARLAAARYAMFSTPDRALLPVQVLERVPAVIRVCSAVVKSRLCRARIGCSHWDCEADADALHKRKVPNTPPLPSSHAASSSASAADSAEEAESGAVVSEAEFLAWGRDRVLALVQAGVLVTPLGLSEAVMSVVPPEPGDACV